MLKKTTTHQFISVFGALIFWLGLSISSTTFAEDKSASKPGLLQLPSAGGTILKETSAFQLQNNTGAATYSVPLPALPTRAGFAPSVSLQYSQFGGSAGNGFGKGWFLSVPYIELSSEFGIPIAGHLPSGEFRNIFTLNGKRLVFVKKQGNQLIYAFKAAAEDIKIIYHPGEYRPPHAKKILAQKPTLKNGFEVIYPNGQRQFFSGDLSIAEGLPGNVARFPLHFEVATTGEIILYQYQKVAGYAYLTDIVFAGGKSRYHFDLIDTKTSIIRFAAGFRQANGKLYSRLTASFDDDIHAQWCFAYIGRDSQDNTQFTVRTAKPCLAQAQQDLLDKINPDSLNVIDELRAIYRFGHDAMLTENTLQLPKILFDYSTWTAQSLTRRKLTYQVPTLVSRKSFDPQNFELADINMDGLVDVLKREFPGKSYVHYGTGDLKNIFSKQGVWQLVTDAGSVSPDIRSDRFHFADLNGDSYIDVVEFQDNANHFVYLGGAGGTLTWTEQPEKLFPQKNYALDANAFHQGAAQFIDLNRDGKSDILTTATDEHNGHTIWRVYLNASYEQAGKWHLQLYSGDFALPWKTHSHSKKPLTRLDVKVIDVNGDKLPDLVTLHNSLGGICVYQQPGDFYNPSLTKLLFGNPNQGDTVCEGHGQFIGLTGLPNHPNALEATWFVDVNGDHIVDFVSFGEQYDELKVWLGFGDLTVLDKPMNLSLGQNLSTGVSDKSRSRVADIDGDGQAEIILFSSQQATVIDFNRTTTRQLIKANLLTTAYLDNGLRYDIRYGTSTDELLRDKRRCIFRLLSPNKLSRH
jgi:hypothetical protein